MGNLTELKRLIFASDNNACFIERERILSRLERETADYTKSDKYARIFSTLLSEVSTPILPCDYFAGRVIEALPDDSMTAPNMLLNSIGHMSFDYEKLLKVGLKGILDEILENAQKKGDAASLSFAHNAEIVILAIKDYAKRYAESAEAQGLSRMAHALRTVPFSPANDFYSALQSIWLIHMIASCYVGSRDYAFGKFDRYMHPYYEQALAEGQSKEALAELLAGFMIKTNEIAGRTTFNYKTKPVLCQASKQYITIGGTRPNVFSFLVLEAAMLNQMAQPQITVTLNPDADPRFTDAVFHALSVLTDKMHIYNFDRVLHNLMQKGIPEEIAANHTFSGCCAVDLDYHTYRLEYYVPAPQIFVDVLGRKEYVSLSELTETFREVLQADLQNYADERKNGYYADSAEQLFVLDSIMLSDSAKECRHACDGNAAYNVLNLFFPGIATIGDSLMILDQFVFREKRFTYGEFMHIVKSDYAQHPQLLSEIKSCIMFGNDSENDRYTVMAANICTEAADHLKLKDNFFAISGFYSLERDNSWKMEVGATPNGRKAGEPFSENQSPTYGADKNGITALLKSIAKLPFDKAPAGGLNLTFSGKMSPDVLKSLVLSYFSLGGLHVGISIIDREVLKHAMSNPEKHQSLTVRLYGFSEYFVSLPEWQQLAVLERTSYS